MPIEVSYSHEGAGVKFVGKGIITGEDLLEANAYSYRSAEVVQRIRYFYNDFLSADHTDITQDELRTSIQQDRAAAKHNKNVVVAIVAAEGLLFGMSRMYEILAEDIPWETFTTTCEEEAKFWIKKKTGLEVL